MHWSRLSPTDQYNPFPNKANSFKREYRYITLKNAHMCIQDIFLTNQGSCDVEKYNLRNYSLWNIHIQIQYEIILKTLIKSYWNQQLGFFGIVRYHTCTSQYSFITYCTFMTYSSTKLGKKYPRIKRNWVWSNGKAISFYIGR